MGPQEVDETKKSTEHFIPERRARRPAILKKTAAVRQQSTACRPEDDFKLMSQTST
jgi:hypothetical protein